MVRPAWRPIATVAFNNYLGALGTDRPLMYFLVAAVIIVLSTSFFWVTLGQWIGGSLVCYAFFLPFLFDHSASRADTVFSVFGRLGGEEFCVLLPDQAEDKARALADRLRTLLAAVPRPDGRLTVSAGIAGMRDGESVMQTLNRADMAMLKAKQSGRDMVCVADEVC